MSKPLNILYEDNHLLVIDKPAPLATMGVSEGDPSLVTLAKEYLRAKYNKPGNVYLGVVSRLDSFVTGVIVLARTSKAAARLTDQFRRRSVEKTYWAIVADTLPSDGGVLEHDVWKNDSRKRMEAVAVNGERRIASAVVVPQYAKRARLGYRVLGQAAGQVLIEVQLETGRKHQIRVQLEAIGCSIVGDRKYGSDVQFPQGIALHARTLSLDHPTSKQRLTFESSPPDFWKVSRFGVSSRG